MQGGQNGFSGSAPQQGQGQQGSQFFAQGQQPGGGGNGGAYNIAGLLGPAALAQIASSAGVTLCLDSSTKRTFALPTTRDG